MHSGQLQLTWVICTIVPLLRNNYIILGFPQCHWNIDLLRVLHDSHTTQSYEPHDIRFFLLRNADDSTSPTMIGRDSMKLYFYEKFLVQNTTELLSAYMYENYINHLYFLEMFCNTHVDWLKIIGFYCPKKSPKGFFPQRRKSRTNACIMGNCIVSFNNSLY